MVRLARLSKKINKVLLASFLVLATIFIFGSKDTNAVTYDVAAGSSAADSGNPSCSLSEAIKKINDNLAPYPECVPTDLTNPSDYTISLPSGTITLAQSLDTIRRPTNIVGQGRDATIIEGANQTQMFLISLNSDEYSAVNIEVRDFTAKNIATSSGARCIGAGTDLTGNTEDTNNTVLVENVDTVDCGQYAVALGFLGSEDTVSNVNLSTTSIVAATQGIVSIYPDSLSVKESSVSGYMVGVFHSLLGSVSQANSNVDITNTTVSGNKSGIIMYPETNVEGETKTINLNIENSSVIGNMGFASDGGFANIANTTGIIFGVGANGYTNVTLQNNIIANNQFNNVVRNCFAGTPELASHITFTSSTNNLSDDTCANRLGSSDFHSVSGVASLIGPLQNNGGEIRTMGLLEGSAALDQGVTIGSVSIDARGVARPQGAAYDIGAFEKVYGSLPDDLVGPDGETSENDPNNLAIQPSITPTSPKSGYVVGYLIATLAGIVVVAVVIIELLKKRRLRGDSIR